MNIFSSINSFCIQRITTGAPAALKIKELWEPNDGYFSTFVLRKKEKTPGGKLMMVPSKGQKTRLYWWGALWGKQGDKKGKCLGKINFLTSVCTRSRNQQSAIWISKIWPKVVKLSADCATKQMDERRGYTDEARQGGKQGDKERRRKHSRDYKCSSRCNAQFIFIFLIRS